MYRGHLAADRRASLARLFGEVLGTGAAIEGPWRPFAFFDGDDCIAGLEAAILPLLLDGDETTAAAVRSVAVHPKWRGRGLFRRLMSEALAWSDRRTPGPALLYTEEPALYGRFGFRLVPQHAFAGPAPSPQSSPPTRRLELGDATDLALIRDLAGRRAAISSHVALGADPDLLTTNLAKEDGWSAAFVHELDAVVVYSEGADGDLVIADVIAPAVPSLPVIIGALGLRPDRVKMLFPPDRLGWSGEPEVEDTGLMIRGALPPAMLRPFMFSPLAEF